MDGKPFTMVPMLHRTLFRLSVCVAVLGLIAPSLVAERSAGHHQARPQVQDASAHRAH